MFAFLVQITKEESVLDFSQPAQVLHNKVRAFAGWPGTIAKITALPQPSAAAEASSSSSSSSSSTEGELLQLKVVRTRVPNEDEMEQLLTRRGTAVSSSSSSNSGGSSSSRGHVVFAQGNKRMLISCGGNTWLEVLEVSGALLLLVVGGRRVSS